MKIFLVKLFLARYPCAHLALGCSKSILKYIIFRLAHNCLTFDFIGTSTDESSDDLCTVQIPTTWRPAFLGRYILYQVVQIKVYDRVSTNKQYTYNSFFTNIFLKIVVKKLQWFEFDQFMWSEVQIPYKPFSFYMKPEFPWNIVKIRF